jgi:hypothetical protein
VPCAPRPLAETADDPAGRSDLRPARVASRLRHLCDRRDHHHDSGRARPAGGLHRQLCLAETASSWPAFRAAGFFAVNILSEAQRDASTRFATRGVDKFGAVAWRGGHTGAPLIDGSVAWFDCRTESIVPAGDHAILLGRVVDFACSDGAPLGYCRGAYVRFGLDGAAFTPHAGGVRVSAIIERRGAVLLRDEAGRAALPSAQAFGPADDTQTLLGQLGHAGVATSLPFVFASYDTGDTHHVVYRGLVTPEQAVAAPGWRFVPLAELPHDRMDAAEADMLALYAREREAWAYGRYVGDALTWAGA